MSLLVWKIEPSRTSSSRSSRALTRLPLWRDGDLPVRAVDQERLRVLELALARRRVARVADRDVARQRRQRRARRTRRRRGPSPATTRICVAVGGGDAGALLAAMLQRVEAEVGEVGRLGMAEDAEDAALVVEFVEHAVCRSPVSRLFYAARSASKYRSSAVAQICSASSTAHVDAPARPATRSPSASPPVRPIDARRHAGLGRQRAAALARSSGRDRHDDARGGLAEQRRDVSAPGASADDRRQVDVARRCRRCRSSTRPASPRGRRPSSRAPTEAARRRAAATSSALQRALARRGRAPAARPRTQAVHGLQVLAAAELAAVLAEQHDRVAGCLERPRHARGRRPRSAPTTPMTGVG